MNEMFFKAAFFLMFFSFAGIMVYFSGRARNGNVDSATRVRMHNQKEVPLLLAVRTLFGIPFYIGILLWAFVPKWMNWSTLALPDWARMTGLFLGAAAIVLNLWSHHTLSRNLGNEFDPALRLNTVSALVTDGPYRVIRHPIYASFLLMQVATLLLTANWLIGLSGIAIILAVILIRIPEEERLLANSFGTEFENYKTSTGAFLPSIGEL